MIFCSDNYIYIMNESDYLFSKQIIAESTIDSQNLEIAELRREKKILETKIKELVKQLRDMKCRYHQS